MCACTWCICPSALLVGFAFRRSGLLIIPYGACASYAPSVTHVCAEIGRPVLGGVFALRAHCTRTARYFYTMFPPKSLQAHPLETPLELGDPNCPSSRKLQTTFPSHNTHHAQLERP